MCDLPEDVSRDCARLNGSRSVSFPVREKSDLYLSPLRLFFCHFSRRFRGFMKKTTSSRPFETVQLKSMIPSVDEVRKSGYCHGLTVWLPEQRHYMQACLLNDKSLVAGALAYRLGCRRFAPRDNHSSTR
ncbi:unnamed protein product [Protopolystoma xenopodis]|uniref:Uncharacterized protein n=1 Tax=Protopolystoma xenopodis TaxID=117903 RepID=A0A448XQL4_9PLAT|nr:unnamed protein product [Protopolystoma xenopodis]